MISKPEKPSSRKMSQDSWDNLPVQERAVQWAAHYADFLKVEEVGGNNKGKWVEKFLKLVGLGPGYAWCAAFTSECLHNSGWTKYKSAAVLKWREWGSKNKVGTQTPVRGALAYWVRGSGKTQDRHIEIVISVNGSTVETIGGNTSSGMKGSQNDGQGVYRRTRLISDFTGFIEWWKVE